MTHGRVQPPEGTPQSGGFPLARCGKELGKVLGPRARGPRGSEPTPPHAVQGAPIGVGVMGLLLVMYMVQYAARYGYIFPLEPIDFDRGL